MGMALRIDGECIASPSSNVAGYESTRPTRQGPHHAATRMNVLRLADHRSAPHPEEPARAPTRLVEASRPPLSDDDLAELVRPTLVPLTGAERARRYRARLAAGHPVGSAPKGRPRSASAASPNRPMTQDGVTFSRNISPVRRNVSRNVFSRAPASEITSSSLRGPGKTPSFSPDRSSDLTDLDPEDRNVKAWRAGKRYGENVTFDAASHNAGRRIGTAPGACPPASGPRLARQGAGSGERGLDPELDGFDAEQIGASYRATLKAYVSDYDGWFQDEDAAALYVRWRPPGAETVAPSSAEGRRRRELFHQRVTTYAREAKAKKWPAIDPADCFGYWKERAGEPPRRLLRPSQAPVIPPGPRPSPHEAWENRRFEPVPPLKNGAANPFAQQEVVTVWTDERNPLHELGQGMEAMLGALEETHGPDPMPRRTPPAMMGAPAAPEPKPWIPRNMPRPPADSGFGHVPDPERRAALSSIPALGVLLDERTKPASDPPPARRLSRGQR